MPIAWTLKQNTADRQIKKFGSICVLRRTVNNAPVDRQCSATEADFTTEERTGKLIDPIDRMFLVSIITPDGLGVLDPPPDNEKDILVTYLPGTIPSQSTEDAHLKIVKPPSTVKPGNVPLYWELTVRGMYQP